MIALDSSKPINCQHPLNRGLMAWYLSGIIGRGLGLRWYDLTADHRGVLTNMDPATDWVGTFRKGGYGSLDLDGTNDHVVLPTTCSVRGLTAASMAIWFNPRATPTGTSPGIYYESTATSGNSRFALFHSVTTGFPLVVMRDTDSGASFTATESVLLTLDVWQHLVVTVDTVTDQLVFYRNGISRASNTTAKGAFTAGAPFDTIAIGGFTSSSPKYLNGRVDDFRLWKRALSAAEVYEVYKSSQNGHRGLLNPINKLVGKARAFQPAWASGSNIVLGTLA